MTPWESLFYFWETILKNIKDLNSVIEYLLLRVQANEKEIELATTFREQQGEYIKLAFKMYSWYSVSNYLKFMKVNESEEYMFITDVIAEKMKLTKSSKGDFDKMTEIINNCKKLYEEKVKLAKEYNCSIEKNNYPKIKGFEFEIGTDVSSVNHGIETEIFGKEWYESVEEQFIDTSARTPRKDNNWLVSYDENHKETVEREEKMESKRQEFAKIFESIEDVYNGKVTKENSQQLTDMINKLDEIKNEDITNVVKYCKPFKTDLSIEKIKEEINALNNPTEQIEKPKEMSPEEEKALFSILLDENNDFRTTSIIDTSLFLSRNFEVELFDAMKMAHDILKKDEELWKFDRVGQEDKKKDVDVLLELLTKNAYDYVNSPMLFLTWIEQCAEINRKNIFNTYFNQ